MRPTSEVFPNRLVPPSLHPRIARGQVRTPEPAWQGGEWGWGGVGWDGGGELRDGSMRASRNVAAMSDYESAVTIGSVRSEWQFVCKCVFEFTFD